MTPDEIAAHADRIVRNQLDDGIEFCQVYEDEELQDETEETWRAIHDLADKQFRSLTV